MDSGLFLQILINGLLIGTVYGLVALGLTLVLSILDSINFAHGEMFMLGGILIYFLFAVCGLGQFNLPTIPTYFLALLITMVIVGLFGMLIETTLLHPFIGKHLPGLILTLGIGLILQTFGWMVLGTTDKKVPTPFPGIVSGLGASMALDRLIVAIIAVIMIALLWYFIKATKIGQAMRATSQDREAAMLQGISMRRICAVGLGLSCALAGGAGALIAPTSVVNFGVGEPWLMKSFIIIIVGGMGSIPGSLLAGIILGFIESFGSFFFSIPTATVISFGLVIIMLLLRPRGLLGHG